MLNQVNLIGRVGQDPELRNTGETKVVNISLKTSEKWKNKAGETQEKTEWHRLVFWDKLAEIVNKYVQKGSLIYVSGKLTTEKYQDKDGRDVYTTKIQVRDMKMLGGKSEQKEPSEPEHREHSGTVGKEHDPVQGQDDDDLPF